MKLKIDGREMTAMPDETILQAARREGVFIPSLCYSDPTEPTHSCRLCMVEVVEGDRNKLVASCAFKVKEGMEVRTDTDRVARVRKTMLQLLYAQAPENPAILALMDRLGAKQEPAYINKEGQCILCGLCVQTCKKLGAAAITTQGRGTEKEVNTPYKKEAFPCIGCASCAEACPTKCIEVVDTQESRTIWNKTFPWVRCEVCGAIVSTDKHYKLANGTSPVLCPTHRRKYMTDLFADTLGEGSPPER